MDNARHIAIFISFSGQGGVEHMVSNLARGFLEQGFHVDIVLVKARGDHLASIPKAVNIVSLGAKHTYTSLFKLSGYLKQSRPDAVLAAKDRAIKVAVLARIISRTRFKLAGRLGTTVSAALKGRGWFKKFLWYSSMRLFYRGVDRIIAVSQGVADDVSGITHLPPDRITVIRNPVWRPELAERAARPAEHPWFGDPHIPVILGAGRLTRQKDFPTLIRAFAQLRKQIPCKLIIMGEGNLRTELEALASELGIVEDFALPGFITNPYSFLSRSKLFVLSSAWEGSPNVLTEALALGIPVVSTNCPSGPVEILEGGRYGKLVTIGDVAAMAEAMKETLNNPLDPALLKQAVNEYTLEKSVASYLKVLDLN
jgi:glycosyltransferase involved in cell wall biosynthesis